MRRYREKHKTKLAVKAKEYQKRKPEVYRLAAVKYYRKHRTRVFARRFNVTEAEIEALPKECEICGSRIKLCVDHCHKTNRIRGTLCDSCNRAIGFFCEDIPRMHRAIEYLKRKKDSGEANGTQE